jgi:RHS repeat-associated protein
MDSHSTGLWNPPVYPTEVRYNPFTLMPLWNYQGKAEIGVLSDGGATTCKSAVDTQNITRTNCVEVTWPRMSTAFHSETGYGVRTAWHGSLIEDKRDASGLLYRRNRMYDPMAGQFTQQDPAGFAGGLNLYAYAGGDPVNYSDPFGLCPYSAGGDGRTEDYSDCPPGSSGWYAQRLATNSGNRALNWIGGSLATCGESSLCQGVLTAVSLGAALLETAPVTGGINAVRAGQAGEAAVQAVEEIGPKVAIRVAGRTRIPDGITKTVLTEVKNVKTLSYTQQLRDFASFASANGLRFDLWVRRGTSLSQPLIDAINAGTINLRFIP